MTSREDLVAAFRDAGRQLWLVGGALRDRLLELPPRGDADYATDALPDEIEALAAALGARMVPIGRRYGTIGVEVDGQWSEITTFRGDSYAGGTRWPEVTFGRSIEEDLARRDFTMNALAEDLVRGGVIDRHGGQEDIANGIIRAIGEPARRFREDPLRVMRAARFASQLGFTIEPGTAAGMRETAPLLASLSQERVTSELERTLLGRSPSTGLTALWECEGLAVVLPELVPMVGCEQNRFHRFDVWRHTLATVDAIAGEGEALRLRRWAALLHDLGKPGVRHIKPNGEWGFFRHEAAGAAQAAALLDRLRVGRRESLAVTLLVRRHMDRPNVNDRRSVRRFVYRCGELWRDLLALKIADNASHTYDDSEYHDALEGACERVEREDAEALRAQSPLSGDDLVALFEREPGPWIRRVKQELSALVLDGALAPGDRPAAERIARRLMNRA